MTLVRAKKHLGQHFLTDKNIASKIVDSLRPEGKYSKCWRLARVWASCPTFCCKSLSTKYSLIDIDTESYTFLQKKYPNWAAD
jgi:16S rRNA (adenine1518-N6/adenine1519-N6)-dimethyltransferase